MRLFCLILPLLFPLLSLAQIPVAKQKLTGSYVAQTYEKDSLAKSMAPVLHKLALNADSTFSFLQHSQMAHCNTNRAGFWSNNQGIIHLNFVGEEPLLLKINEGSNYLSLVNKEEKLVLIKQQPRPHEGGPVPQRKPRPKNHKEPKCPSF